MSIVADFVQEVIDELVIKATEIVAQYAPNIDNIDEARVYHVAPESYNASDNHAIITYNIEDQEIEREGIGSEGFFEATVTARIGFILPTNVLGGDGRYSEYGLSDSTNINKATAPPPILDQGIDYSPTQNTERYKFQKLTTKMAYSLGEALSGRSYGSAQYDANFSVDEYSPTTVTTTKIMVGSYVDLTFLTEGGCG